MMTVERAIQQKGGPLLGICVHTYNPTYVEIAGRIGFDIAWIETEHLPILHPQIGDLCRIAVGVDTLTMVRVPDARRDSVLKVAECGPDIITMPMVNSVEMAGELVTHAKYAPVGNRGAFLSSRAMGYGLIDMAERQRAINEELCVMIQIETKEAVERSEELIGVPGVGGVFIGPNDLASSMGLLGNPAHPEVRQTIESVVKTAKSHGKVVALPVAAAQARRWADVGVDLIFCAGETSLLKAGLQSAFNEAS